MMQFNNRRRIATITIAAGFAISMTAFSAEPPRVPTDERTPHTQRGNATARMASPHFLSYRTTLRGTDLLNQSDDAIASINDLVIDRGSGRVRYVVLSYGGALGVGGDKALLEASRLLWNPADHTVTAALTKAELDQLPKLEGVNWLGLRDSDRNDRDRSDRTLRDPYASVMRNGQATTQHVEGRITKVDRFTPDDTDAEYIVVTIQPVRGDEREVVLGPSWYVMGHEGAPIRGQRIVVEAVEHPDERSQWIASEAEVEGRALPLRGRDGSARWAADTGSAESASARHPYVLASDLIDAPVEALGEAAGEVHDLIVDVSSNRVGFVAIDPNENFLGMADTVRLTPWTITNFGMDETLRIDATQGMITSSPEVPDDVSALNNETMRNRVFQHFQTPPIDFRADRGAMSERRPDTRNLNRGDESRGSEGSGWMSHDQYARAVTNGERFELRGTIVSIEQERSFPTVRGPVTVMVLEDPNGAMQRLHLGPQSYTEEQNLPLKPGDKVVIDARKCEVNDREFVAAYRIQRNGDWIILWNEEGRPAWDNR